MSGVATADKQTWATLVSVSRNSGSAVGGQFLSHRSSGTSQIQLGGYAVMQFPTRQEAVDFANALTFPVS